MEHGVDLKNMGTFYWKYLNNRGALPPRAIELAPSQGIQWALMARARYDYNPDLYSVQDPKFPMPHGGQFLKGDWVDLGNEVGPRVLGSRDKVLNKALYALLVNYPHLWSEVVVKTIKLKLKTPGHNDAFGNLPSIVLSQETWLHLYVSPVKVRPPGPHVRDKAGNYYRLIELMGPQVVGENVEVVKHDQHADIVQWVRDHRSEK